MSQIDAPCSCLACPHCHPFLLEVAHSPQCRAAVLIPHKLSRTKRRLKQLRLRWGWSDAARMYTHNPSCLGGAKKIAHVVGTPHIVKDEVQWILHNTSRFGQGAIMVAQPSRVVRTLLAHKKCDRLGNGLYAPRLFCVRQCTSALGENKRVVSAHSSGTVKLRCLKERIHIIESPARKFRPKGNCSPCGTLCELLNLIRGC
mmetsp:Transcript_4421/g.7405  ORF Transcript_4421/g.7405 Transcript_4421/m.7405 type:complete len:201 (-) Transcript_4421:159-761(-)